MGWFPQLGIGRPGPVLVPGFAGAPAATSTTAAPAATTTTPTQPTTCARTLKGQLDALLQTRAAVAANPLCGEAVAAIDGQINRARAELAQAQPLEVALRGTLGAVANARQALQKAEAKLGKCEQQVVTAVASYDSALAEAQSCRKQLADAEAATARTAGGHTDLRQLFSADPGAAWTAFRMAAEARCVPGAVDPSVCARAAAAFAEMQAICALLPSQPPAAEGGAAAPTPATGATPPDPPGSSSPSTSGAGGDAGAAAPSAGSSAVAAQPQQTPPDPGAVAAAAITAVLELQRERQAAATGDNRAAAAPAPAGAALLRPSSAEVPSQFEAVVAASAHQTAPQPAADAVEVVPPLSEPERAEFQRHMDAAHRETQAQAGVGSGAAAQQQLDPGLREQTASAAAADAPGQAPIVGALAGAVAGTSSGARAPPADGGDNGRGDDGGALKPADDAMGGGAADGVAGKRGHSAISAGRAIAAKAKAKVAA